MSLYNALFGTNPFAGLLLEALGTSAGNIPRFRDCYLSEDKTEIIIHTRTGGGNRDWYEHPDRFKSEYPLEASAADAYSGPWNRDLRNLPGFKYDADDDFDCTYADFHYEIPEAFKPMIETLADLGATNDPAARWRTLLDGMMSGDKSRPDVKRALEVGERIMGQLNDAMKADNGSKTVEI